jgi:hypothetical protein
MLFDSASRGSRAVRFVDTNYGSYAVKPSRPSCSRHLVERWGPGTKAPFAPGWQDPPAGVSDVAGDATRFAVVTDRDGRRRTSPAELEGGARGREIARRCSRPLGDHIGKEPFTPGEPTLGYMKAQVCRDRLCDDA